MLRHAVVAYTEDKVIVSHREDPRMRGKRNDEPRDNRRIREYGDCPWVHHYAFHAFVDLLYDLR